MLAFTSHLILPDNFKARLQTHHSFLPTCFDATRRGGYRSTDEPRSSRSFVGIEIRSFRQAVDLLSR
ncbi:MAG TPA: hypothetical protein DDX19_14560, partial [Rhodopirellula baltica]|nr:hypothetical protein [Rhodopirellula baltica]